ncbi:MAG: hypothetical protein K8L99_06065 [Anaerolineae bacterium]|nr:hypothetical protein [Anaerolineae bacterium]
MIKKYLVFLTVFILFVLVPYTNAQSPETCPVVAQTLLQQVGDRCGNLGQSQLCYGASELDAVFTVDRPNFTEPGARTALRELVSLQGSPFDAEAEAWGIGVLNVQANLPLSLPGATLISFGDVQLENEVPAENALLLPATPQVATVVADGTMVYDIPATFGDNQQTVGSLSGGALLEADGISADGEWLRVYFLYDRLISQRATAWISTSSVEDDIDPSALPVIEADSLTPMQSLFTNNGLDAPECIEAAPASLYVQGPNEIETDLTINGANIRLSSTMLVLIVPPGNEMQVISLSGIVVLNPDTEEEILLPPGFAARICFDPNQDPPVDADCTWSTPTLLSTEEFTALFLALDGRIPQDVQYYRTSVPQLICPSGVGSAECTLALDDAALVARLARICDAGLLDEATCETILVSG